MVGLIAGQSPIRDLDRHLVMRCSQKHMGYCRPYFKQFTILWVRLQAVRILFNADSRPFTYRLVL